MDLPMQRRNLGGFILAIWAVAVTLIVAVYLTVGVVAWHFIARFW